MPLGWEMWLTGGYQPGEVLDLHKNLEDQTSALALPNGQQASSTGIFRYFLYNNPDWSYAEYDFKDFAQKAARVAHTLNSDNPDLTGFRGRGGKLIIDNGWIDGSMSAYNTIEYQESVLKHDTIANKDIRLFLHPGVAHCLFGPGPHVTDYLTAIYEWVESGKAPEQLPTYFRRAYSQPINEGRILCAYLKVAKYDDKSNTRNPLSFSCVNPQQYLLALFCALSSSTYDCDRSQLYGLRKKVKLSSAKNRFQWKALRRR